jgi:hypothetical protein
VQVAAVGSNTIWPNWLATLAVIEPNWPAVTSAMSTRRPAGVSRIVTASWSPES